MTEDFDAMMERQGLFNRQGEPITFQEFTRLRYEDPEYFRVGHDQAGPYEISTVWLGMDHNFGHADQPVIFETMVFGPEAGLGIDGRRYSTEDEARAGHDEFVLLVRATLDENVPTSNEDHPS